MPIASVAVDKVYRRAIVDAAGFADSAVQKDLERLMQLQPDPEVATKALDELGASADEVLTRTRRIVEALDHFYPGFIKWLGTSGWGNDGRLIRLMHAWQLEAERKKWIHKARNPNSFSRH